jgi:hypothetical protein
MAHLGGRPRGRPERHSCLSAFGRQAKEDSEAVHGTVRDESDKTNTGTGRTIMNVAIVGRVAGGAIGLKPHEEGDRP